MNRLKVLTGTVPMILLLTKLGIPWDWLILMVMGMDMGKE